MAVDADLHWELNHIEHRHEAFEYLRSVKSVFCVYSSSVCKLYSNYQIQYHDELGEESIEVMPDQDEWHDTFHHVSAEAVRPSGIFLFPGELFGRKGFYIRLPLKGGESRTVPLVEAFEKVLGKKDNFLPLIRKGDLREFRAKTPYIHLHWLDMDKLSELSTFQRIDMANAITTRFHEMIKAEEV